jgi:hypothetical protein
MRRLHACLSLVLLLGLAAACESEGKTIEAKTQVLLSLDLEPALSGRVEHLRAALWVSEPQGWTRRSEAELGKNQLRWPLDLPVFASRASDENATFEVILEASGGGKRLVQTRLVTRFVAGQQRTAQLTLRGCPGHDDVTNYCSGEECHGPACTSCTSTGACLPVGEQPGERPIEPVEAGVVPGPDAGFKPDARANTPDDAAVGLDAASDSAAPVDASSPGDAIVDAAITDAAVADADIPMTAPDAGVVMPSFCPPAACKAPYPCEPTPLGYTCRGQLADWPMPDPVEGAAHAPSYTMGGSYEAGGVVLDNVTGLEWQVGIPRYFPGCTQKFDDDGGMPGDVCTQQEARAYCDGLSWNGQTDWRLPSMVELMSLFDGSQPAASAATNTTVFNDNSAHFMVSNSDTVYMPGSYWLLYYGLRQSISVGQYPGRVRCVRLGKTPPFATPAERYVVDAAGDTVTDRATGLVWERTALDTQVMIADAAARCRMGFRLPTPNELFTLVDTTRLTQVVDPALFPGAAIQYFWASPKATVTLAIELETGELKPRSEWAYVRCVK